MPAKVTVKRDFYDAAERMLKQDLARRAEWLEAEAKNNAPVRTGALRASIRRIQLATGWKVGTSIDYGGFVEYGTIKQTPQAYLRRAFASMLIHWRKR